MLIGIDIDNVLADFLEMFIRFHNERYGTSLDMGKFHHVKLSENLGLGMDETIRRIYEFFGTPYFEDVRPVAGSVEAVEELSGRYELMVITSRPQEISWATNKWIDRHFPGKFSRVYFTHHFSDTPDTGKKSEICVNLGVGILVEDSLDFASECAAAGIKVLLFDRPWNQGSLPGGVERVRSWKDIVGKLS